MIISILKKELKIFFPSSSLDEENDSIKALLEKNGSLHEEVWKLKREQEI